MGVANVLSTASGTPRARATSAMAATSNTLSIGLLGVSIHTRRVFGRIASRTRTGSLMSRNVDSTPNCLSTLSKMRNVPP